MKQSLRTNTDLRILRYADDLNTILSPLMFMELLTASLITCMLGFQLILVSSIWNTFYAEQCFNECMKFCIQVLRLSCNVLSQSKFYKV
jgi:hypothetical protein